MRREHVIHWDKPRPKPEFGDPQSYEPKAQVDIAPDVNSTFHCSGGMFSQSIWSDGIQSDFTD